MGVKHLILSEMEQFLYPLGGSVYYLQFRST